MKLVIMTFLVVGSFSQATYDLANNGKKVVCFADDNQTLELNATRTTLRYTVEGESMGPMQIIARKTDGRSFSTFSSEDGVLKLGLKKDTFQFSESDEAFEVNCK